MAFNQMICPTLECTSAVWEHPRSTLEKQTSKSVQWRPARLTSNISITHRLNNNIIIILLSLWYHLTEKPVQRSYFWPILKERKKERKNFSQDVVFNLYRHLHQKARLEHWKLWKKPRTAGGTITSISSLNALWNTIESTFLFVTSSQP